MAACDGGGRVGHAVRRRGIGAGRAWRASARHCGAGVRGARCTPLTRAPPAPAAADDARARPHRADRPHRAAEPSASGLQPRAPAPHRTPPTHHNTLCTYLSIVCFDFAPYEKFTMLSHLETRMLRVNKRDTLTRTHNINPRWPCFSSNNRSERTDQL